MPNPYVLNRKRLTMRLTKKLLLAALLPLLVLLLATVFAPTPPADAVVLASANPVAMVDPAPERPPGALACAWFQARQLLASALSGRSMV